MNTKSQNSTATFLAHAVDSDSVATVSTSKTQVFVKRFDSITFEQLREMVTWCQENLYHGGHYEPNWHAQYPTFYFQDEQEYTLFLLRWS
jgi:hypothetical protein